MIELLLFGALVIAGVIAAIVVVIQFILGIIPHERCMSRLRKEKFGTICPFCYHHLDLHRRATAFAYDRGVCPQCGRDLVRMPDE